MYCVYEQLRLFTYHHVLLVAVPGRLAGRGPHSSGIRCEATTVINMSQMVSVRIFPKCARLEWFYISGGLTEWLICRLYLLAEHYSSVQKKTAMQKKLFRKSYEHFSEEHFWDFPKIHISVFTTHDVHTFGIFIIVGFTIWFPIYWDSIYVHI